MSSRDLLETTTEPAVPFARFIANPLAELRDRPVLRVCATAFAALFVLFARRYDQVLDPQVWQEEGIIVLQAVTHGAASLFIPLNGYLLTASRLVSIVALLAPFQEYPQVATLLTWAACIALLCAIALVPSRLRGGAFLALAALLVPANPEVYGIPLYIFWWTVPPLYACYFWPAARPLMWWRLAAIVLSGLSAPTIVLAAPLFVICAIRRRTRDDIISASAAATCALVQLIFVSHAPHDVMRPTLSMIEPAISKLFGGYLVWNLLGANEARQAIGLAAGSLTLLFVAFVIWREQHLRGVLGVLVYLWLGSAALSISRVDVNIIDQVNAGPRYYFLPFVVEGWLLIQIVTSAQSAAVRSIAAVMLFSAAFNALPVLSRSHQDLGWKPAVTACAASPVATTYDIPIQVDGFAAHHWVLPLTGHECHRLDHYGLLGLAVK